MCSPSRAAFLGTVLHQLKRAGLCSKPVWVHAALANAGRADSVVRDGFYSSCHAVKSRAQPVKADRHLCAIFNNWRLAWMPQSLKPFVSSCDSYSDFPSYHTSSCQMSVKCVLGSLKRRWYLYVAMLLDLFDAITRNAAIFCGILWFISYAPLFMQTTKSC